MKTQMPSFIDSFTQPMLLRKFCVPGTILGAGRICVCVWSISHIYFFCKSMDCSPPGSSVHGISQARILEWVAISFSRGCSQPRDQTCISYITCIGRWFLTTSATWEALPIIWAALTGTLLILELVAGSLDLQL